MRKRTKRRKLSMTSLIDVIFLLLLFFMLSSTFSKFSEVELAGSAGSGSQPSERPPLFLQLQQDALTLNAETMTLETLTDSLADQDVSEDNPLAVLIVMQEDVTSQRLTDLLVVLRGVNGLQPTILGAS